MPRRRPEGKTEGEIKRRSRNGCWPCKGRKVKCGEERPTCANCKKNGVKCDYSIRLNWEGRRKKRAEIGTVLDFQSTSSKSSKSEGSSNSTVTDQKKDGSNNPKGLPPLQIQQQSHPGQPPSQSFDQPLLSPHQAFMSAVLPPMPHQELNAPEDVFHSPTQVRQRSFSQPAQSLGSRPILNLSPVDHSPFHMIDGLPRSSLDTINEMPSGTIQFAPNMSMMSPTIPMTPGGFSEGSQFSARPSLIPGTQAEQDIRRLSVNSLLSGPPRQDFNQFPQLETGHVLFETDLDNSDEMTFYGIDRGKKDLDIGKNDDMNAISKGDSPIVHKNPLADSYFGNGPTGTSTPTIEFGFGVNMNDDTQDDNYYYKNPVPILIPRSFEPLPTKLRDNPMNLLYFHHFLNHTAHVLVPHNDRNSNPFRTILPQMAVKNDNLLSLLLAYSASHRARLLQQPEPATRIAHWVEDIFPALRRALSDPNEIISNANLATAIMLASLEIISPRAFGYEISWQKHLSLARDLITARPGGLRRMQSRSRDDPLCSFLWSWFAYLDVLGSLSGAAHSHTTTAGNSSSDGAGGLGVGGSSAWLLDYDEPSPSPSSKPGSPLGRNTATAATSPTGSNHNDQTSSPSLYSHDDDPRDEIDCIMGFTTRCVAILARIADLARRTDAQRIAGPGRVVAGWHPMPEIEARARKLEDDLRGSLARQSRPCRHHVHTVDVWDEVEMHATNEAFHWAGLVHLYRRVLGKASKDREVQEAVSKIVECLERVKRGGNAEACLLFPLFTAGCDSADAAVRQKLLERVRTVEGAGMSQVHRARTLMETVWATGQPWETLISTEFIG